MFALPYASFIMTAIMRPIFIPIRGIGIFMDCLITSLFLIVILILTVKLDL